VRIVVPLDRSAFGETAIPHALGLARGGTIALVTAIDPMLELTSGIPEMMTLMQTASSEYLDEIAKRLPKDTNVEKHVLGRPVTAAINAFAEDFGADLIVMSTHGRGPMSRFWLGSVTDRLSRMSTVPLYLVRPPKDIESRPDAGVAITVPLKILVPVDGSDFGAHAVQTTGVLGPQDEQALQLLRIASYPIYVGSTYLPGAMVTQREIVEQVQGHAERYVEGLASELRAEGRTVDAEVISAEFIAPAILAYATEWGADAIALSTHGRSGFTRVALGSVADKIVRESEIPVLLTRAEDTT
jgi:nucleotide-binding universal stress UspA family protein